MDHRTYLELVSRLEQSYPFSDEEVDAKLLVELLSFVNNKPEQMGLLLNLVFEYGVSKGIQRVISAIDTPTHEALFRIRMYRRRIDSVE